MSTESFQATTSVTGGIVCPQNSHVEVLQYVTLFGDKTFKDVVKVK